MVVEQRADVHELDLGVFNVVLRVLSILYIDSESTIAVIDHDFVGYSVRVQRVGP